MIKHNDDIYTTYCTESTWPEQNHTAGENAKICEMHTEN